MTDREKLTKLVEESFADQHDRRRMIVVPDTVNHLLANGVVVREKGEWVAVEESKDSDGFPMQRKCLCCGKRQLWMNAVTYNFCPNCGADMRRRENNG